MPQMVPQKKRKACTFGPHVIVRYIQKHHQKHPFFQTNLTGPDARFQFTVLTRETCTAGQQHHKVYKLKKQQQSTELLPREVPRSPELQGIQKNVYGCLSLNHNLLLLMKVLLVEARTKQHILYTSRKVLSPNRLQMKHISTNQCLLALDTAYGCCNTTKRF